MKSFTINFEQRKTERNLSVLGLTRVDKLGHLRNWKQHQTDNIYIETNNSRQCKELDTLSRSSSS
jgi:hypothetical protein